MKMMKILYSFTFTLAVCYFTICFDKTLLLSHAQESNTKTEYLTLENAIEVAINNNPLIPSKIHNIEASKGRVRQAGLLPNPEIEFFTQGMPTNNTGFDQNQNSVA